MTEKAVDLDAFAGLAEAQEAGIPVPILGPDGNETGLTITVAGPDSERQKKARLRNINKQIARRNAKPLTAEEITDRETELLAESIVSWTPVKMGGKEIECSVANAVMLFKKFPFIMDQVNAAAGNRAGFLPK